MHIIGYEFIYISRPMAQFKDEFCLMILKCEKYQKYFEIIELPFCGSLKYIAHIKGEKNWLGPVL